MPRNLRYDLVESGFGSFKAQCFRISVRVPNAQDFHRALDFVLVVVNEIRMPQHLARSGPSLDGLSDEWIASDGQSAVEQLISNAPGNLQVCSCGQSGNGFFEIGDEEFA